MVFRMELKERDDKKKMVTRVTSGPQHNIQINKKFLSSPASPDDQINIFHRDKVSRF